MDKRQLLAAFFIWRILVGFALLGEHACYFPAVLMPLLVHAVSIAVITSILRRAAVFALLAAFIATVAVRGRTPAAVLKTQGLCD